MSMEVTELVKRLNAEWTSFKAENDRRLKELEVKGRADPLAEEKIDRHSRAIGELQAQLDELSKRLQRRSTGAADVDEARAAHRNAFRAFIRRGVDAGLTDLEVKAALSTTVDTDGGYAIPEELERTVGTMERQLAPMEAEVTSVTAGAETYEKLLADGMAASGWVGETDARPETGTPTLASFRPSYGELYANPKATQKMLDDAFFDVEAWLTEEIAQTFAQQLDAAIVAGNGTNKPKGILAYPLAQTDDNARPYGTIEKVHTGTAGSFSADNLIDLVHKLRPGYRQGAKFLMAGTTAAAVRKLKDSTGQYLWTPGLGGQPATLLGYPIVEDENMPVVAASANAIVFGDLRRAYKLVNVRGIRVLRDPFTATPFVRFYATKRVGGGVEDTRAVKVLTLAA